VGLGPPPRSAPPVARRGRLPRDLLAARGGCL